MPSTNQLVFLSRSASASETKLLAKTIALAQLLWNKNSSHVLVQPAGKTASVRFRYLLSALLQIVRALGVVEKAIGVTDRYLNLVQLLSHFSFPQALELLKDARWVVAVERKLLQSKHKRCFVIWHSQIRVRKPYPEYLQTAKASGSDPKHSRLVDYQSLMKPKLALAPTHGPLITFFQKWRLSYRLGKVLAYKKAKLATRALHCWHKWTMLKAVYEYRLGRLFRSSEESSFPLAATQGPLALAKFAFKEWRGMANLLRRDIDNYVHERQSVFEAWRRKTEQRRNQVNIAILYDSVRNLRPAFMTWCSFGKRTKRGREVAGRFSRQRLLDRTWDQWRGKKQRSELLNRFLGRWRGRLEFNRQSLFTAHTFLERKLIVAGISRWRQRTVISNTLHNSASRFVCRRAKDQKEFYFSIWRRMLKWINHNSEKMRTIRAARIAQNAINHWRAQCRLSRIADRFSHLATLRIAMKGWMGRLESIRANHIARGDTFEAWRRLLMHRRAIQGLYKLGSLPKGVASPELIEACRFRQYLLVWRKRAIRERRADLFRAQKESSLKNEIIKSWRLDTNVAFYLKQKPWRAKKRLFRKLRAHQHHLSSQKEMMMAKLDDHLQGKKYIIFYRTFERWQQIFQARKMEEHLCSQNLAYYHHHRKTLMLHAWKLLTAHRMFLRYKGLQRRNAVFKNWYQNAQLMVSSRRTRLLSRLMTRWRHSYRDSIANGIVQGSNRRVLRLAFISWRAKCHKQRYSHSNSTEFIGNSSMRYFLQKWRTELTVRKGNKSFAARGRQIPWKELLERPRYQNYQPLSATLKDQEITGTELGVRRNTLTLPRGPLVPELPAFEVADSDFVV